MDNRYIKSESIFIEDSANKFEVNVTYSTATFGTTGTPFWEMEVFKVNNNELNPPLKYTHKQAKGMLLMSKKFIQHKYYLSIDMQEQTNQTNIYPLIKDETLYQYYNKEAINFYKSKVKKFCKTVEKNYENSLKELKEQKYKLKKRLKSDKISTKEYQKLYQPIRKDIENLKSKIYDSCHNYNSRYFEGHRLKDSYLSAFSIDS